MHKNLMNLYSGLLAFVYLAGIAGCATRAPSPETAGRKIAEDGVPVTFDLRGFFKECFAPSLGSEPKENLKVNGHLLTVAQARNVQWISRCVLPYLPGTPEEKADVASKTTWWALREGILDLSPSRVFRYSNCTVREKKCDKHGKHCVSVLKDRIFSDQPLWDCPTRVWQVGIAAGQVWNYSDDQVAQTLDRVFSSLDPGIREEDVLRWTATLAGFPEGTDEFRQILDSAGKPRRSWLLRNPLIGFLLVQDLEVRRECLIDYKSFCHHGDSADAVHFSHTRTIIKRSIADLKKIYLNRSAE